MTMVKKISGFSLIEVMVAVVVLAIGLLALAKFQSVMTENLSYTKDRASALVLAERKLEDLRAFTQVKVPLNANGDQIPWSPDNNIMAFDYIKGNQEDGIAREGGTLNLAELDQSGNCTSQIYSTENGQNLCLTWKVEDANIENAKQITVKVNWNDKVGELQQVQLSQIVSSTNPSVSSPIIGDTGMTIDPPRIIHNPGLAPEIVNIDVDTGGGLKRETGKPLPDVYHKDQYTKVNFDVVTYNSLENNAVLRREEFINVNCLCTASTGVSYTPAYTVFENSTETIRDVRGSLVDKATGEPANSQQPNECTLCCRDHTNPDSPPQDATGQQITYEKVNYSESGSYDEFCRMKYVDGILSVFQDWSLADLTVFPASYVEDGMTSQSLYRNYVQEFVKDRNTDKSTLTERNMTVLVGGSAQAQARALYIDEVFNATSSEPTYSDYINQKISGNDADTLQFIPFFEVNLTKLADWSSSNCGAGPCVTDADIVDESLTENNYSRGLVFVKAEGDDATPASSVITASVGDGNAGIVGRDDGSQRISDNIIATVGDSSNFFDITIQVELCNITGQGAKNRAEALLSAVNSDGTVSYYGDSNGSCQLEESRNNASDFTCNMIPVEDTVNVVVSQTNPIVNVTYTSGNQEGINADNTSIVTVQICDE